MIPPREYNAIYHVHSIGVFFRGSTEGRVCSAHLHHDARHPQSTHAPPPPHQYVASKSRLHTPPQHRFFSTGKYWREGVVPTLAPSMDICVSSNFERYLFHLSGDDGEVLAGWLKGFEATGLRKG